MNKKANNTQIINGILLVNKPLNLTSNAVLQKVKRLFNAKKAGHTGSLDPIATGMLPICFGEATKFCQYLLDADKCYEVTGCLGIKTSTSDATGEIISTVESFSISATKLQATLLEFLGPILQIPSMYSALKHQGTPLYRFARAGIEIERKAREITIHHLQLNHFDGRLFHLTVRCSKGTYIRNLVEDIGERLGVGAHVTQLHRSYTAGFDHDVMFSLDDLAEKPHEQLLEKLLPMERAIAYLPMLTLNPSNVQMLREGKQVSSNDIAHEIGLFRLYDNQENFIGLGEANGEFLKVKRLLAQ